MRYRSLQKTRELRWNQGDSVCVREDIICFLFGSHRLCAGTAERQQFCSETSPLTEADPPPSSAPQSAIKNTSLLLLHHHESHGNGRGRIQRCPHSLAEKHSSCGTREEPMFIFQVGVR